MKGSHPRPADQCPFVLRHSISQVTSLMRLGMLCVPAVSKLPNNLMLWRELRYILIQDPKASSIRVLSEATLSTAHSYGTFVERPITINLKRYKSNHCEFFNIHMSYHMKNYQTEMDLAYYFSTE